MCAAMRAVAYSTAAACFIIGFISPRVAPDWVDLVKRTCGDNWNSIFKKSTNQQY